MFQFQALGSGRFQCGFDRVNLHRPTRRFISVPMDWKDPTQLLKWSRTPDRQGRTLVHYFAQHKHIKWDTLGA